MKVPELHDAPLLQCFFCSQDTPKVVPTCKKHSSIIKKATYIHRTYLLLIWNGKSQITVGYCIHVNAYTVDCHCNGKSINNYAVAVTNG